MTDAIRTAFRTQAVGCRALEAPFTATLLETLADTLDTKTRTGARILDWPAVPLGDALPLRITGGLHALARSGKDAALSKLYTDQTGDFAAILGRVLVAWDDQLVLWLDSPPQTNEVGRSGALMAGLMVAADRLRMPMELLEIGASAGLNLNLDRFHYQFGARSAGPEDSTVQIAPSWTGNAPPDAWPEIYARAAVDQNPLNPSDPGIAERLLAYIWPDQPARLARSAAAIEIARQFPPGVEKGDAADWIAARLTMPQATGTARIVMHSVFWQYLPGQTQQRIEASFQDAATRATQDRPFGWLSFEPAPSTISPMLLKLRLWPGGEDMLLATCHPHGTVIEYGPTPPAPSP